MKGLILLALLSARLAWGANYDCKVPYGQLPPVPFHPETGVFGLTASQRDRLVELLREHFGDQLLAGYAIGSRVAGNGGPIKNNRPVSHHSDLDLVVVVRRSGMYREFEAFQQAVRREGFLGFPLELHLTNNAEHDVSRGTVTSYQGGIDTYYYTVPPETPPDRRQGYHAVQVFPLPQS